MKKTKYGVARSPKLTKSACLAKAKEFAEIAEKSTGEKRRKVMNMAAWYKNRAKLHGHAPARPKKRKSINAQPTVAEVIPAVVAVTPVETPIDLPAAIIIPAVTE